MSDQATRDAFYAAARRQVAKREAELTALNKRCPAHLKVAISAERDCVHLHYPRGFSELTREEARELGYALINAAGITYWAEMAAKETK